MSRVHEALVRAVPPIRAPEDHEGPGQPGGNEDGISPEFSYRSRASHARAIAMPNGDRQNGDADPCADLPARLKEEAMKLVQRVFVFPNSQAPSSVVFSSVEGSGSSEICFATAQVLAAQVSASVCLVSASFPALYYDAAASGHAVKEASECRGLMAAVGSSDPIADFVLPTTRRNLWLMPLASRNVAIPSLFPSEKLRSRMMELKEEFDYVLIDAPPVASSSTAVVLGQMADGVIMVVEANSTRHETARIAKETFEAAKVRLLGAILNNHTAPLRRRALR